LFGLIQPGKSEFVAREKLFAPAAHMSAVRWGLLVTGELFVDITAGHVVQYIR
jgi:hypothetical protein